MAWTLTVNFQNDPLNAESRDAFAEAFEWQGATDPRAATKAAFRDYCIRQYLKEVVRGSRLKADIASQPTRVTDPDTA